MWEEFPFDEKLDYAEDREWSWRVLEAGFVIAFDPMLWVDLSHSWRGGVVDFYRRQRRGVQGVARFSPVPGYRRRDLVREWWSEFPDDLHSPLFHRLNYRRLAGLLGKYRGHRSDRG